jgi:hypothetical protein
MSKNAKVIETENIDNALQLFIDAYYQMSPGDEVTLTIKAPPKETVKLYRVVGPEGTYIYKKINEALTEKRITEAGYVSMDSDYKWYYSKKPPEPSLESGVHVTNESVFLFNYRPETLEHEWDKMIKYVC